MVASGLSADKILKGKQTYLASTNIGARRAAAIKAGNNTSWSNVMTPPKDLQSDDLDLFEWDAGAKRAWGIAAQRLKDEGYDAKQALYILNQGYNANDNWDDDRGTLKDAEKATTPRYNRPK